MGIWFLRRGPGERCDTFAAPHGFGNDWEAPGALIDALEALRAKGDFGDWAPADDVSYLELANLGWQPRNDILMTASHLSLDAALLMTLPPPFSKGQVKIELVDLVSGKANWSTMMKSSESIDAVRNEITTRLRWQKCRNSRRSRQKNALSRWRARNPTGLLRVLWKPAITTPRNC